MYTKTVYDEMMKDLGFVEEVQKEEKTSSKSEREKVIELLDHYYGDCRNRNHKEEIADFVESHIAEIAEIYREWIDLS